MILINSAEEINGMRKAGAAASEMLRYLVSQVKPGITTNDLDRIAESWVKEKNIINAPLGYKGFPKSICTSVNEVICHGIPCDYELKDGDIINIDVTPLTDGFHGDTSVTVPVGKISNQAMTLIKVTQESLNLGIKEVRPGATLGDIGAAIQEYAESAGFSVVRDFVGHGIGRFFHGPPIIYHFGTRGKGTVLRPGMIFTIEPMINVGSYEAIVLEDKWTTITSDGELSAQFEHTILVTEGGVEVLTL